MSILLFSQQSSGGESSPPNKTGKNPKAPSSEKKKLQLIMVREELFTLTGNPRTAAILGQFLY